MTDPRTFRLHTAAVRERCAAWVRTEAPDDWIVKAKPPGRSLDQNAALWPLLQAFSEQLEWPVNGRMCKLAPDEWKDVLSACFKRESQRVAMGIDGGMVLLGLRTSKLNKREFSELLEFVHSVAADRGVNLGRA